MEVTARWIAPPSALTFSEAILAGKQRGLNPHDVEEEIKCAAKETGTLAALLDGTVKVLLDFDGFIILVRGFVRKQQPPIQTTCPSCRHLFKVPTASISTSVSCPCCMAQLSVPENVQGTRIRCPGCKTVFVRPNVTCPSCAWGYTIDTDGRVTDGSPIRVVCPECSCPLVARKWGEVQCPSCKCDFEFNKDGNITDVLRRPNTTRCQDCQRDFPINAAGPERCPACQTLIESNNADPQKETDVGEGETDDDDVEDVDEGETEDDDVDDDDDVEDVDEGETDDDDVDDDDDDEEEETEDDDDDEETEDEVESPELGRPVRLGGPMVKEESDDDVDYENRNWEPVSCPQCDNEFDICYKKQRRCPNCHLKVKMDQDGQLSIEVECRYCGEVFCTSEFESGSGDSLKVKCPRCENPFLVGDDAEDEVFEDLDQEQPKDESDRQGLAEDGRTSDGPPSKSINDATVHLREAETIVWDPEVTPQSCCHCAFSWTLPRNSPCCPKCHSTSWLSSKLLPENQPAESRGLPCRRPELWDSKSDGTGAADNVKDDGQ